MRVGIVSPPIIEATAGWWSRTAGIDRLAATVLAVPAHRRLDFRVLDFVETISIMAKLAGGVPVWVTLAVRGRCWRNHQCRVEVVESVSDRTAADTTKTLAVVVQATKVPL